MAAAPARRSSSAGAGKNPHARRRHGHDDPAHKFNEADFRGERFKDQPSDLRGNNDLLTLTQPEAIKAIHIAYLEAGADIIETNTFSSTTHRPGRLRPGEPAPTSSISRARDWRGEACDEVEQQSGVKRFVAGSMGPTNRTASISPDVNNPGFRAVSFDDLRVAYRRGGARPYRRRRRRADGRDDLRHAERQGGALSRSRTPSTSSARRCRS